MVAHLAASVLLRHQVDIIRNDAADGSVIVEGIGEEALVSVFTLCPLHRHGNRIPAFYPGALREGDLLSCRGEIVHPTVRISAGAVLPCPFVPVEEGEPAIQPKPTRSRHELPILHRQIQPVVPVLADGSRAGGHAVMGTGALSAVVHLNAVAVPVPQLHDGLLTGIGDLAFGQVGGKAGFLGRKGFPRGIGGNIVLRLGCFRTLGAGDQAHRHKDNGDDADQAHPETGLAVVQHA